MTENSRKLFDKFTVDGKPIYLKDLDLSKLDSEEIYNLFNILNVILAYVSLMQNSMKMCMIELNKDGEPRLVTDTVFGLMPFELKEDGGIDSALARKLLASHYCAQKTLFELMDGLRNFLLGELYHVAMSRYYTDQDGRTPTDMKFHYCDDDYDDYIVYRYMKPLKGAQ
jgi:hypothetical protein